MRQRAYITTFTGRGGFFIYFKKSISFLSKTFKAASAARRAGIAYIKKLKNLIYFFLTKIYFIFYKLGIIQNNI